MRYCSVLEIRLCVSASHHKMEAEQRLRRERELLAAVCRAALNPFLITFCLYVRFRPQGSKLTHTHSL